MPLTVTRLGHASVLLDFAGTRILTDPLFIETATCSCRCGDRKSVAHTADFTERGGNEVAYQ